MTDIQFSIFWGISAALAMLRLWLGDREVTLLDVLVSFVLAPIFAFFAIVGLLNSVTVRR